LAEAAEAVEWVFVVVVGDGKPWRSGVYEEERMFWLRRSVVVVVFGKICQEAAVLARMKTVTSRRQEQGSDDGHDIFERYLVRCCVLVHRGGTHTSERTWMGRMWFSSSTSRRHSSSLRIERKKASFLEIGRQVRSCDINHGRDD